MFDRETAYQLARLHGLLGSGNRATRRAARRALSSILGRHGVSEAGYEAWRDAIAQPWLDTMRREGLSLLAAPADIRPEGVWYPMPAGHDGPRGYMTAFRNGLMGHAHEVEEGVAWTGGIDGQMLREGGAVAHFSSLSEVITVLELVAQRMGSRIVVDDEGGTP